ncbi:hypothetical protein F0562_020567 [Nyssa sinensis]|uniref:Uncharacterized protein n=1 Tax=Nyssa sinensis TaxID=561372 RepID=A0A5J5BWL3_9ASTE|nr:hypothetical protein F0562_020567 [Nyssa sinensis]
MSLCRVRVDAAVTTDILIENRESRHHSSLSCRLWFEERHSVRNHPGLMEKLAAEAFEIAMLIVGNWSLPLRNFHFLTGGLDFLGHSFAAPPINRICKGNSNLCNYAVVSYASHRNL